MMSDKEGDLGRVEGKVCLVTGAANGIGRATAQRLASEGGLIVATDINKEGEKVVDEILEKGGDAIFLVQDVTDEKHWEKSIEQCCSRFGGLDVLINNAGILLMKPLQETSLAEWNEIFRVNVTSIFLGTKLAFEPMRARGGGSIVNLSSIYGLVGAPTAAAYEASKGAIRLFSKGAATEYASHGIRVNSLHPGVIDTPMAEHLLKDNEIKTAVLGPTLLGRAGTAEEIAGAALYLASDESSFVVGTELIVDGGYTCN